MKRCIIIILFITEMSDDKILLDQDLEVGHGNNTPPTHQPEDQPPPIHQPEQQPPPNYHTEHQPSPQWQPNPQPQPDHANNVPGSSNNMPAGRGCGVYTGIARYIYTQVFCL